MDIEASALPQTRLHVDVTTMGQEDSLHDLQTKA